jgi:hypothetical protein
MCCAHWSTGNCCNLCLQNFLSLRPTWCHIPFHKFLECLWNGQVSSLFSVSLLDHKQINLLDSILINQSLCASQIHTGGIYIEEACIPRLTVLRSAQPQQCSLAFLNTWWPFYKSPSVQSLTWNVFQNSHIVFLLGSWLFQPAPRGPNVAKNGQSCSMPSSFFALEVDFLHFMGMEVVGKW